MRSRASSLPRWWCRSVYFGPPPASALACSASTSASLASIASRLAGELRRASVSSRRRSGRVRQQHLGDVDVAGAQPLAEALGLRVEAPREATPSPSSPSITKLSARRLGNTWRVTTSGAASGSRRRSSSTVSVSASHGQASPLRAHTPTLALPPLSPERAPATVPSGSAARRSRAAARAAPARRRRRGAASRVGGSIDSRVPSARTAVWATSAAAT